MEERERLLRRRVHDERDSDGGVRVTSQHFAERVTQERAFPLVGKRSVRVMRRIVERAKKRLQKQEQRLIEIKEEFKW